MLITSSAISGLGMTAAAKTPALEAELLLARYLQLADLSRRN
jgi:hypothetical protein